MAGSIHTTRKDVKGLTGKEVTEQLQEPESDLCKLARKCLLKKAAKKNRKKKKDNPNSA